MGVVPVLCDAVLLFLFYRCVHCYARYKYVCLSVRHTSRHSAGTAQRSKRRALVLYGHCANGKEGNSKPIQGPNILLTTHRRPLGLGVC